MPRCASALDCRHLRGDDGRALPATCSFIHRSHTELPGRAHCGSPGFRPHPHQSPRRRSSAEPAMRNGTVRRVPRTYGRSASAGLARRTSQRVLEEREVFHAGGHIVRAPPRHTPQVPAIHGTFNGLAAEFRRVVGFQHILRRTDFLEPHRRSESLPNALASSARYSAYDEHSSLVAPYPCAMPLNTQE